MREETTIKLYKSTKELLNSYKILKRESYNDLINRLIKEVEVLQNELDKHN